MLPALDSLEPMSEPFEILELRDGETAVLVPVRWELGKATITPRDGRPPKEIRVLRVHVDPADKPTVPAYWDITSQHLIAALLPYLEQMPGHRWRFTIRKHGWDARARFRLEAVPLERG